MNILPNTIIVFPDSFDSMKQFNLDLKYSSADYAIYELGEREQEEIYPRLLASGIAYIYIPETLTKNVVVNYFYKENGEIFAKQDIYPLMTLISFNQMAMDNNISKSISKEQSRLGNKYSIVELLSGD